MAADHEEVINTMLSNNFIPYDLYPDMTVTEQRTYRDLLPGSEQLLSYFRN